MTFLCELSLSDWTCRFESVRVHRFPSLLIVVCCQVEMFATDRSLVQRCPTECSIKKQQIKHYPIFLFHFIFLLGCFHTSFHYYLLVLPFSSSLFAHLVLPGVCLPDRLWRSTIYQVRLCEGLSSLF